MAKSVGNREIEVSARKGGRGVQERTDAGKRIPRPCASSSAWLLPCLSRAPPAASPALPVPLEWYSGGRAGELWPLLPLRLTLPERVVEASSMRSTRLPTQ